MNLKDKWKIFGNQVTFNDFKMCLSAAILPIFVLYGWGLWMKAVAPIIDKFHNPNTPEEAVLYLCAVVGFIAPLFCIFPAMRIGLWLGKILGFYNDIKTKYLVFDDISYFVGHMPEEQREKIREMLSDYRSKTQLRKDAKKNQSWFRRKFR